MDINNNFITGLIAFCSTITAIVIAFNHTYGNKHKGEHVAIDNKLVQMEYQLLTEIKKDVNRLQSELDKNYITRIEYQKAIDNLHNRINSYANELTKLGTEIKQTRI